MVNESTYSVNPDEEKTDRNFIDGDAYEEIANDIIEYYKDAEKTGNINGNVGDLKEACKEAEGCKDGECDDEEQETLKEAGLSPEEYMKMFDQKNKELADAQAKVAKTVARVDIVELYDGYCAAEVTFKNGETKEMEFEIEEAELKDMFDQLVKKAPKKFQDELTIDDAAVAVIRRRVDPSDALDWFYKPTNTSLDQWFLDQEIERENAFTNYDRASAGWAKQVGLIANDEGEFSDDDFWANDDGSRGSYTDNHDFNF